MHHGLVPFVDVEGALLRAYVFFDRFRDDHVSNEGRIRSQSRFFNLVANRAGDSVGCSTIAFGKFLQRKPDKNLSLPSLIPVSKMDRRHMASRALILDSRCRLRMIN